MPFLTEPEPARGEPHPVATGIRRVVAPNPSVMTYWGTNTYLIDAALTGGGEGVVVLDPGPDDAGHVAAVLAVAGGPVRAILLSHGHHDHLGATRALQAATGAPVHAWNDPSVSGFQPDVPLHDGDLAWGWQALHTPGHAPDHLCFAGPGGVVFSADHIMSWSSSVVGPPGGNMRQYFASLQRMLARDDTLYLPGHGPPLAEPRDLVQHLLAHRQSREAALLGALGPEPQSARALMEQLYEGVAPSLQRAAERNVTAHLQKLAEEGRARDTGAGWTADTTPRSPATER